MRIAITGSHGVGKSTLANDILAYLNGKEADLKINITDLDSASKRKDFKLLEEAPRQAFELGLPINENNSPETQLWVFAKQLEMELIAQNYYIADKCFIDLLAYVMYIFREKRDLIDILKDISKRAAGKYDLVIYLPAGEFPIEDDGVRSTDPEFQDGVDKLILEILNDFNINYVKIIGNKEERYNQARELIKSLLK